MDFIHLFAENSRKFKLYYFNGIIGCGTKGCKEFDEASKRKPSNEQEFVETANKGELIKYLYSMLQFFDFACNMLWQNEPWYKFSSGTAQKVAGIYKEKLLELVGLSYIYPIFFCNKKHSLEMPNNLKSFIF